MSNPTISIPRSQKRWQISTIFTPEKMHTAFVPSSIQFTIHLWKFVEDYRTAFVPSSIQFTIHLWKFVEGYHTTFVTVFIPPSFYQDFPTAYQSVNSKISQFSQLSQLSQNSRLSQLSTISTISTISTFSTNSRLSLLSTKIHPSTNSLARQPRQWQQKIDKGIA